MIDLTILNSWWQSAKDSSQKKHWEWFVIDQMLRGNQNIRGNPNENTVEVIRDSGKINYPINKMFAIFRAVRGYVTRHKPIVIVEPKDQSEEAKSYARQATKILERDNQINNFRKICKDWVYYGIKYGVGYRQIGYDPQKKCAVRWTIDPFDLWNGSKSDPIEDTPYLIKTVKRTMAYLKNKYPKSKEDIQPDNELAADQYKQMSMNITFQNLAGPQNPFDEQTAIVKECWYRVIDKNKEGGHINKCTFLNNVILDQIETPYDEYPFISYKSEIVPNEEYPDGHMKHIVAPQRMFNLLNTQMLEYNHLVNRGRWIKDKNCGFKVINAQEGQIIEKNPGTQVTAVAPPVLSPLLEKQMGIAQEAMDTIGGMHDASMGAVPQRVNSGDAIEALQMGDSTNILDLRDNFEDALQLEAQWVLKMYSLFEGEGIPVTNTYKQQEQELEEKFAVVGSEAEKKMGVTKDQYYFEDDGYHGICHILPDNEVKVSVTSQLGETRSARLDFLMKLVEMGLPLKYLLEHLEFPNTGDILERIASEVVAETAIQGMAQPGMPGQGMGQAPPPPPDEAMAELQALAEE